MLLSANDMQIFLRAEVGGEVHLEGAGELRRRTEGEVDVLVEHLRYVRTRHLHALRKLRLRYAQLLHPEKDAAEERGADMVNSLHRGQGSGVSTEESGVRSQYGGVRGQESVRRGQRSGVSTEESGVRSQYGGVRGQESVRRSQESGVSTEESGVRSQYGGVRSQESVRRSQRSGVSTEESEVRSQCKGVSTEGLGGKGAGR